MDIKNLNRDLTALVELKNKLSTLDYSDKDYDRIEEKLHDEEDEFLELYGDYLEDALNDVHDEYCPDTDVLLPIAYLPNKYEKGDKNEDGTFSYKVDINEGVIVEVDDYPGLLSRIVLVPGPPRLLLNVKNKGQEVVWTAK